MALTYSVPPQASAAAEELRTVVRGDVLVATDELFHTSRQVWNGAVDRHPLVIARCVDDGDVAAAVRVARELDLPLCVRGGGHDWAGRSVRDGGVVLDLSRMNEVTVHADSATATVQGGTRAGDLVAAAHRYGFAPVTGTVSAVGVVGLTLGGGYGLLNGRHGLALDNLVEARVVLADGTRATASAGENPDLHWALRGGGGNFGVVTSAKYRVHPVGPLVAGLLMFPLDQAVDVLRGYREVLAEAPDELTVMSGFFCGPDGNPMLFLLPSFCGDPTSGRRHAAWLQGLGAPVAGGLGELAYRDVIALSDGAVVDGRHSEVHTRWLPELTGESAEKLVAAAARITSPFSAMFLHHFHGAAARVPAADTAFALRRDHLLLEIVSTWAGPAPDDGAPHRDWARSVSDDMAGTALSGGYVNLLGPDEPDRVSLGYGPNLARLTALKRRFDPDRVFSAVPELPS